MRLKICCQVCGKVKVYPTHEPVGPMPRWESYTLPEIISNIKPYLDHEIWICPSCIPLGPDPDDGVDQEKLEAMVRSALQLREDELQ